MNKLVALVLIFTGLQASAKHLVSGSDTMGGLMTDAILAAGLDAKISYVGGGSGVGEKAFINGEIGMTAMSRALTPAAIAQLAAVNVTAVEHVVALDGLGIFVQDSNQTSQIDFITLTKVFSCEITTWQQIPGSGKTGSIRAFRRDDKSGTTDTFKNLVGIKNFGACVTVLAETADMADHTSREADAIGYSGLSGKKDGNKTLAVSRAAGQPYVNLNTQTVRNGSYPLSRALYIYEATGARTPNAEEQSLLDSTTDRSFMDPIVQDHDFITID